MCVKLSIPWERDYGELAPLQVRPLLPFSPPNLKQVRPLPPFISLPLNLLTCFPTTTVFFSCPSRYICL